MRALTIAAIAAMLCAGCVVGPDYKKPDVDVPQAFQYEPKDAADTANTEWWKQFGDPVLDSLIAEALRARARPRPASRPKSRARYPIPPMRIRPS